MLQGYLRADGRKGVRNVLVVAYLVECAHHVAREIATPFRDRGVHLIGFPGCYPNPYSLAMMEKLCTHPNVGGALLVSLGCEGFDKRRLARTIEASGRPVLTIGIQDTGGTRRAIAAGREWIEETLPGITSQQPVAMSIDELTVGTICGGSDATSGLTANPAMGIAFDLLVAEGAKTIFEETGELIGMEHLMAARAASPALGEELKRTGRIVRRKAGQAVHEVADATEDARTTAAIKARLALDANLSVLDISVDTTDGRVTLAGHVDSTDDIARAIRIVLERDDVREVVSTIQVRQPEAKRVSLVR